LKGIFCWKNGEGDAENVGLIAVFRIEDIVATTQEYDYCK
jgi:hypothetical protein